MMRDNEQDLPGRARGQQHEPGQRLARSERADYLRACPAAQRLLKFRRLDAAQVGNCQVRRGARDQERLARGHLEAAPQHGMARDDGQAGRTQNAGVEVAVKVDAQRQVIRRSRVAELLGEPDARLLGG